MRAKKKPHFATFRGPHTKERAERWGVSVRTMQLWKKTLVPVDDDNGMVAWYSGLSSDAQRKLSPGFVVKIQGLIGGEAGADENTAAARDLEEFERSYRPGVLGEKDDLAGLKRERAYYLFRMQKARARQNHALEAEAAKQFRAFADAVHNAELLAQRLGRDLGESFAASDIDRLGRALAYWLMSSADVLISEVSAALATESGTAGGAPLDRETVRKVIEPLVIGRRVLAPMVRASQVRAGVALPPRIVEAMKAGVASIIEDGAKEFERLYGQTPCAESPP